METSRRVPRVLVVGCGAIGGVVASHLLSVGHEVSVLTTNQSIARALREDGFIVESEAVASPVPAGPVLTALEPETEPFDYVLLAVQPPQVEEAARDALPALAEQGRIVCFQNGLCEERVAAFVGRERVVGGVIAWGASMRGPGRYERTSSGGFTLGRLEGPKDEALSELGLLLEAVGPVALTDNLRGVRWSKLGINCAVSTLGTISGGELGGALKHRHARRLALEIITEAVSVARAEGVRLEKVATTIDLGWLALKPSEARGSGSAGLMAKHGLLLAVGARYRRLRSSMLAAIERGREPAVDFLNGEIVEHAKIHGISAPVNAAARDMVWSIARGERQASQESLRALYDDTR